MPKNLSSRSQTVNGWRVAAGVVVGSLSMVFGFSAVTLTAEVVDPAFEHARTSYRQFQVDDAYRRRSLILDRKYQESLSEEVPASHEASPVDSTTPPSVPIPEDCATKVPIVLELQDLILSVVPHRPVDVVVRATIEQTFEEYVAPCKAYLDQLQQEPVQVPSDAGTTEEIDQDHCSKYSGKRRMNCLGAVRDNIRFRSGYWE